MSKRRKVRPRGGSGRGSKLDELAKDELLHEKFFSDVHATDPRRARKDAQLCAQVREAVQLALSDAADPRIHALWVLEVEPAPHVGQLRVVTVAPADADLDATYERLEGYTGALRRHVANAIHRKKTPSLSFVVLREDVEEDPS
ncbi:MAG: hypothetical protein AB7S26_24980 [Sandaracinaceae bacterium]